MSNLCINQDTEPLHFVDASTVSSFDYLNSLNLESKKALISTGDSRFNGMAVLSFLHERYTTAESTNSGNAYKLPLYDKYKQQVVFPLNVATLIAEVSVVDAANKTVYFPFIDLSGNITPYPLRDSSNNIVLRPASTHNVADATTVYGELDAAYNHAKDSHAYNFNQQLLEIKKTNKLSFFKGSVVKDNNTLNFFTAAVFNKNASSADLTNIHSSQLDHIIRYYHDRADTVYNSNKADTPISTIDTTSNNSSFVSKITTDQNLAAANSIISTNYWDVATPLSSYKNNKIKTSSINASIIQQQETIDALKARIESLEASIP